MKSSKFLCGLISLIITVPNILIQPANAEILNVSYFKYGECRIDVGIAHYSDYFAKKGIKAVKVNVLSECFMRQEITRFKVSIKKSGKYVGHTVVTRTKLVRNLKPVNKPVYFEGTYALCKNDKPTSYYGTGQAWATINGKEYATRGARSKINVTLNCGT